jgi:hypothetical protein
MDKYFLAAVFGLFISLNVNSQVYVSPNGDDTLGVGSIQNPYETIGKAISVISKSGGDTILIREGIYHEEINISGFNSDESSPTIIKSYENETVVIDGTIEVNDVWSDDPDDSAIKFIENVTSPITQLFVGNDQMVMARWPNAQFDQVDENGNELPYIFDKHNWAEGDESTSLDGQLYIDETKKDPGAINLINSIGILNVGSFKTFNRLISSHTQQSGNDLIEYSTPIGEKINLIGGQLNSNEPLKDKHHYFFFEGKKEFIDVENEWFLDTTNDKLNVYPPSGVNLNNITVRGKIRDYSLIIDNSSHIKIEGLTFFATTFKAESSSYLRISNCKFYYPSHSRRMLKELVELDPLGGAAPTTLGPSGSKRVHNSTIESCLFMDAEGEGLLIMGDNNKVLNSYFKNIDWSATELDGLMVTINVDGVGNEFSNNEVYNTGASATVWPGEESIFSYNVVSNTGLAQSDGAVFQGTKNCVSGSFVHHNFVYQTKKYAFRYDAPGGDATEAGRFGVMHHNIADQTMGLMIKGNNQIIANNTVINTVDKDGNKVRNDIIILAEDCSNNNTWLYNNLAKRIGSHRSSTNFSTPDDAPIPINTMGYLYDDVWRACNSTDSDWTADDGTGQSLNNLDEINDARNGITTVSAVEALLSYNDDDGLTIDDFIPIDSNHLIDKGVSPNDVVLRPNDSNDNPTSATLSELVPQVSVGLGPDIGAIDEDNIWNPGINWTPEQSFDINYVFTTFSNNLTEKASLKLYPNPTNDIIQINREIDIFFSVYDVNGMLLIKGIGKKINLSKLSSGIYFIQLQNQNGEKLMKKIVKK